MSTLSQTINPKINWFTGDAYARTCGWVSPPYFKSKMKGTTSIPSHTWVEAYLYYLLSCDESVREAIDQTKSWLLQDEKLNFYDFSNCREAGWHLMHLCSYQEAFSDNECLNAASIIVESTNTSA